MNSNVELHISLNEALKKTKDGGYALLFVYGTLKRGERNHHYMINAYFIGKAKTKEKYWRTGFIYVYDKPIKGVEPKQIEGELYLVPLNDLYGDIDRLEGHPHEYKRKQVDVVLLDNNEVVNAYMYFINT